MPGRPEFTIHTPNRVTIDDILDEYDKVEDYFANPINLGDYFTFDLRDTNSIEKSGLIELAKIAHQFEERFEQDAKLQFVMVNEEAYPDLMNTNIGGKRLISIAEIYTRRSHSDISEFMKELDSYSKRFGLHYSVIADIGRNFYNSHKRLHGSYAGMPNYSEMMRRRDEYKIILAQRFIEDKTDVAVLDHLGYMFGGTGRIMSLSQIPDMLKGESTSSWKEMYDQENSGTGRRGSEPDGRTSRERPSSSRGLEEGITYQGGYDGWVEGRGFGFLREDETGQKVFVHFRQIHGDTQLRPGRYSFQVHHEPGKKNPEGRNVTLLEEKKYNFGGRPL